MTALYFYQAYSVDPALFEAMSGVFMGGWVAALRLCSILREVS